MKQVLIVSPRFPPVNAADHQRIRMALPYFHEHGWHPTILCVDPSFVEAGQDPHLMQTVPADIPVESVAALSQHITRKFGFGGLSWRAKKSLNRRARQLLAGGKFDLVYFSTTEFGVLPLATEWKNRFQVPYVLDIQDPWVNDYYRKHGKRPPGGAWKHGLTQMIARWQEGDTLRHAAAITTVSKQYQIDLIQKYPFLSESQFTVLPFGGPEYDFEILDHLNIDLAEKELPSRQEWLYIGRAGYDMQFSIRGFFCSVRKAIERSLIDADSLRIRLYGTDYSPAGKGRKWSQHAAEEFGLVHLVEENPARLPYFETLKRLRRADALFVPGSDDPGYTASKIYPYILAKRPLLTLFHQNSSVTEVLRRTQSATSIHFNSESTIESVAEETVRRWFLPKAFLQPPKTEWTEFARYSARAMTSKLTEVFDRSLSRSCYRIAS